MIADRDFKFHLVDVGRDFLVVGLLALGHDIERVADVHGDHFVLRRVLDAVFADEQHAAFGILLVDPQIAGGQRHAEPGLFFVLEFVEHHHRHLSAASRDSGSCGSKNSGR